MEVEEMVLSKNRSNLQMMVMIAKLRQWCLSRKMSEVNWISNILRRRKRFIQISFIKYENGNIFVIKSKVKIKVMKPLQYFFIFIRKCSYQLSCQYLFVFILSSKGLNSSAYD